MFILGLLSIIQITFLPGILILKTLNVKKGFIQTLIFSFALSLIANHILVLLLTFLKINYSYIHYGIFAVELGLLWKFYLRNLSMPIGELLFNWTTRISNYASEIVSFPAKKSDRNIAKTLTGMVTTIFVFWSLESLWWAIKLFIDNIGTVFTIWDSVASWNRWALDWFSNTPATITYRYAQLIPTSFSVTYSFMGSSQLQFFAKGFMPIFILYMLLLMLDLGLDYKKSGYFIGLVATRYILQRFLGPYIGSGYVDAPLAFFTLLTVYTLLKAKTTSNTKKQLDYVFLGTIFAAGTALTKQNGLLVFTLYPVLAYFIIVKHIESLTTKEKLIKLTKYFLFAFILLLPWYVFNEYRLFMGEKTNVAILAGNELHKGRAPWERFLRAISGIGIYAYLYLFVLLTLPFNTKDFRKIIYAILIPYSLIWGFLFSLETRNMSIALPLLGLATGLGAGGLTEFAANLITKFKITNIKTHILIILLIVIMVTGGLLVPSAPLIDYHKEQQKHILNANVTENLYQYFEETGNYEPVFTNYPLEYLPDLENLKVTIGAFTDYNLYKYTRAQHPEVNLMLIEDYRIADEVLEEIMYYVEQGDYEIIFQTSNFTFVRILNN
ncbi:MAG: hypothetical protein B6243_03950 [Anaerolineaceae bacterium 4572_5.2]|nr:MAG: hypothetical protein B6243_03950 [Anaerolineaceae bacterium 4572_5.2]